MAQNDTNRRSAIDARSQRVRKRIEEIFGWGKDVGPIRKTKFRGKDRVGFQLLLTLAGYNLIRMRNILAEVPTCSTSVSERCETDKTPQAKANATDKFNSIDTINATAFDNAATTNQDFQCDFQQPARRIGFGFPLSQHCRTIEFLLARRKSGDEFEPAAAKPFTYSSIPCFARIKAILEVNFLA